ncbi:hypothetical protein [Paenibacillus abyssi]|uniref:IDEAL domain-containing protein n=1 Tax=Paenibacillus abyssi TaxID=1340531 RepID=A0A917FU64_9BACL|nr:hypothetical protein [Paenibacillus abyssi]GGG03210.1 hypothetical protein GCM10010916_20370 [Paenibacillus abyssi]
MKFEISDWVQGTTRNGELIHGFIETIDRVDGIVKVNIVESDNEDIIGKHVAVREYWLKKLPLLPIDEPEHINNLIDIALSTWDEAWFMELSAKLKAIQHHPVKVGSDDLAYPSFNNRLGLSRPF